MVTDPPRNRWCAAKSDAKASRKRAMPMSGTVMRIASASGAFCGK
ncbi:Uncharacterised protein [Mycobacterium tuberculosis]|nr:Uncharacterised protein [Mycobacterium tuberculosis]